jgi:uncharacterized protein (TIGR02246 family)
MHKRLALLTLCAVLLAASGGVTAQDSMESEALTRRESTMTQPTQSHFHGAIVAANETFMDTFNSGDAAGLAALYTEDAQLLPPNADFVTGHAAIQAFWQAVMDMGITGAVLVTGEVEGHGDTVIEVSTFQLLAGGQVVDEGKYIVIWKRDRNQWKLHRDIFNSSLPAPGS